MRLIYPEYYTLNAGRQSGAFALLHEKITAKSLLGCVLIGAGTLLMVL